MTDQFSYESIRRTREAKQRDDVNPVCNCPVCGKPLSYRKECRDGHGTFTLSQLRLEDACES
jgi:hypothetical protein